MNDIGVLNSGLKIDNHVRTHRRRHVRDPLSRNLLVNGLADVRNVSKRHKRFEKVDPECFDGWRAEQPEENEDGTNEMDFNSVGC